MNRLRILALAGALLLSAASTHALSAQPAATIWRGRSGGFDVTWTSGDISARRARDGVVVFSARAIADREWGATSADSDDAVPVREWERTYRVLSLVGPILSLQEETYCDCGGAHPISWTRFVSYDLSTSTAAAPHLADVTRLVDEASLVRALTADPLIRQAMDAAGVHGLTRVAQFGPALEAQSISPPSGDCTFALGKEFASEFGLHHLDGTRVAVRFSLSHSVEVCRGMMIQVGVLAVPLASMRIPLREASGRQRGFLMKDRSAVAGRGRTVFSHRVSR
jgi:hypothetical protein